MSEQEPAQAEELPAPKYYFSFDEADGAAGITPTAKGAGEVIEPAGKEDQIQGNSEDPDQSAQVMFR